MVASHGRLLLSRKPGETIVLPELEICISVRRISKQRVQVSIECDRSIQILRGELLDHDKEDQ